MLMAKNSLSIYQLRMYARKWLKEVYNMELNVPLEINGRLKTTCGRFVYIKYRNGISKPKNVEMNKYFVENNEAVVVLDVLRHELVHYALFMQRKPHSDGDSYFEKELRRLGVVSQNTIDKYTIASKPKKYHYYQCASTSCAVTYKRSRALDKNKRYRCKCGGRLIDKGKRAVSA
jgi:SprT-like protein